MRPDWSSDEGPSSTKLWKLGEKFGLYFKCNEMSLENFKHVNVLYFKKTTPATVGRLAQK